MSTQDEPPQETAIADAGKQGEMASRMVEIVFFIDPRTMLRTSPPPGRRPPQPAERN